MVTSQGVRSHLVFTIDFRREVGSVARVFAATHDFILMCERMDAELIRCLGVRARPVMEVGRVEANSIKTFLRQVLVQTEDSAIEEQGVHAFVAPFLVAAKHAVLRFLDASDHRNEWERAARGIDAAAQRNRPAALPPYVPPRPEKLLDSVRDYERMKRRLKDGDHAYLEAGGTRYEVDLSARVDQRIIEELKTGHRTRHTSTETLVVKKPDFLGNSRWQLYFRGQLVSVTIEDRDWLEVFQRGGLEIRPQDGLHCRLRVEESYAQDGRWLFSRYYIPEVLGIVSGPITGL